MSNPNPPDNLGDKRMTTAGPGRPRGSHNKLTRERLELEIKRLALSNILDAFDGVHGNRKKFTLRELKAMPEDFQRCIASVKVKTENLTVGDDSQDITVEIRLWSKTEAQKLAAECLGMRIQTHVVEDLDARKARLRTALARPQE